MPGEESAPAKRELGYALLLLFAGFVCGAALLHLLVLHPLRLYGAERSEKLALVRHDQYAFTSAAFGSSHIHLGFDPRVFDATLANTPLATRSVNLGLNGGAHVEQRVMALDFLDHFHPRATSPCFVLLEATAPADFSLLFASNPRRINIYDQQAEALAASFPTPGDTRRLHVHIRALAWLALFDHAINLGMLSNRLFSPPLQQSRIEEETANDRRGFDYEPPNRWGLNKIQHMFADRPATPAMVSRNLNPGHLRLSEELHNAPNGPRVQLIWIVTPGLEDLTTTYLYPASQHTSFGDIPIINLARPDLHPELYRPELWVDDQHVTEAGAKLLTGYVTQSLLELAKEHRIQQNCGEASSSDHLQPSAGHSRQFSSREVTPSPLPNGTSSGDLP